MREGDLTLRFMNINLWLVDIEPRLRLVMDIGLFFVAIKPGFVHIKLRFLLLLGIGLFLFSKVCFGGKGMPTGY